MAKPKITKMDERIRTARQQKLLAWNQQWNEQQIRRGVNPAVPEGRKDPSDYNQHGPIMDSSGAAQDVFFARAKAIMKMGPMALGLEPQDDDDEEI